MNLKTGTLVGGTYRILREIGRGGMSVVYLAVNERANRIWAVKAIRREGVRDFEAVKAGIAAEAGLLKTLRHPGLPDIADVIDDGDSLLIVMGYIEGKTLAQKVAEEGPQKKEDVIRWGRQICSVLMFLHGHRPPVLYRDLKPSNVMLKPDGMVVLIDFGTACRQRPEKETDSLDGYGTRGYAAPEQIEPEGAADARTDLYGFGATLYCLLTGKDPKEPHGKKGLEIPRYARSELGRIVEKCTRPDPAARFSSSAELMQALRRCTDAADPDVRRKKRRRRAILAGFLAGCVGLVGMYASETAGRTLRRQTCEALLEQAKTQESMAEAKPLFLKALELDAALPMTYEAILTRAEADIMEEDGILSSEVAAAVNECLNSSASGPKTNLQILKEQDPQTYVRILYEIGLWYFFLKGDTDQARMTAAENYFSGILEDKLFRFLPSIQQETVKRLYEMGQLTAKLHSSVGQYTDSEADESENYRTLFTALSALITEDLRDGCGREIYAVKLCQQAAAQVGENLEAFERDGVSRAELRDFLKTIRTTLESFGDGAKSENREAIRQALETVAGAERLLEI